MSETNNRGKWQLLLMIAMVLGVVVAGFVIFPKSDEQRAALLKRLGTTNHGYLLLEPLTIDSLALNHANGAPWVFSEQKNKWRLVIIGDEQCDGDCEKMLFLSHQVHLLLGKKSHRVERILISSATLSPQLVDSLKADHPYLKALTVDKIQLQQWLETQELTAVSRYGMALLVDQKGLAMMRYGPEHDGGQMLEDVKHLLKYSPAK